MLKVSANREGISVSLKHVHEIMESVKGKKIDASTAFLKQVLEKKSFVPFRKYPSKGHKGGVPAGYPVKATKFVMSLLNELKANAKSSGADADKVIISGYDLGRGGYPRYRGGGVYRHGKRTNLRIFSMVELQEKPKTEETKPVEATPQAAEASVDVTKKDN
jgi:ribosomal protein L22